MLVLSAVRRDKFHSDTDRSLGRHYKAVTMAEQPQQQEVVGTAEVGSLLTERHAEDEEPTAKGARDEEEEMLLEMLQRSQDEEEGLASKVVIKSSEPMDLEHSRVLAEMRKRREKERLIRKLKYAPGEKGHNKYMQYIRDQNVNYHEYSAANPVRYYLRVCHASRQLVLSAAFQNYITACIVAAGILVGVQTYPELSESTGVIIADDFIILSFSAEIVLKVFAEGLDPSWFFLGPERWWNLFDVIIVVLSNPLYSFLGSSDIKLFRLIRLSRLLKVFNKVQQLQVILSGLVGGIGSVFYIVVLLMIMLYLFSCAGIILFRQNDSWHFHSVEIAMLNLLTVATMDSWSDQMFTNFYGCDVYSSNGLYYTNVTDGRSHFGNDLGANAWCQAPQARPAESVLFYVFFIAFSNFCVLSLFVSTVSTAMNESIDSMKAFFEQLRVQRDIERINRVLKDLENTPFDHRSRKQVRMVLLMRACFRGKEITSLVHHTDFSCKPKALYKRLSLVCHQLVESNVFNATMTAVILAAGINVAVSTDATISAQYKGQLGQADNFILYIFTLEIALKIVAEYNKPLHFFHEAWNVFDFFVVLGSYALDAFSTSDHNLITTLRLLRLLRVLKLARAVPELQVIVSALFNGLASMFYIVVILFIFFYFMAIIGITYLGLNDHWHYSTLLRAMLTMFQLVTFDNWGSTMATTLYGCSAQPAFSRVACDSNQPQFILGSIYYVIIILVGGLVLLALFIGVVSTSMEEANITEQKEAEVRRRARIIQSVEQLSDATMQTYFEVFTLLDMTSASLIAKREMQFGLKVAGIDLSQEDLDEIWGKADRDGSSGIDFAEFLEFVMDLRFQMGGDTAKKRAESKRMNKESRRALREEEEDEEDEDEIRELQPDGSFKVLRVKRQYSKSGRLDLLAGAGAESSKDFTPHKVSAIKEEDEEEDEEEDAEEEGKDGASDKPPSSSSAPGANAVLGPDGQELPVDPKKRKKQKKSEKAPPAADPNDPAVKAAAAAAAALAEEERKRNEADKAAKRRYDEALLGFKESRYKISAADGRRYAFSIKPVIKQLSSQEEQEQEEKEPGEEQDENGNRLPSSSSSHQGFSRLQAPTTFRKPGGVPWPQPPLPDSDEEDEPEPEPPKGFVSTVKRGILSLWSAITGVPTAEAVARAARQARADRRLARRREREERERARASGEEGAEGSPPDSPVGPGSAGESPAKKIVKSKIVGV